MSEERDKVIYIAVPLLPQHVSEEEDEVSVAPVRCSCASRVSHFVVGASVGAVLAIAGMAALGSFGLQDYYFLFSVAWSFVATLAAYLSFSNCMVGSDSTAEHVFAIGDFVGYCAALITLDIQQGVPASSLVMSIGVALLFITIMVVYSCCATCEPKEIRKGTVLPMVFV